MKNYTISKCGNIKLNSFHPLCENAFGLSAINSFGLSPFLDASCRREPDFENPYPSITALCRAGKFAPHLKKNDIVAYITIKGIYPPHINKHYRLVAILKVEEVYQTHKEAAEAYLRLGLPIPNNCMIDGNEPKPFIQTASNFLSRKEMKTFLGLPSNEQEENSESLLRTWNNSYLVRSRKWPMFIRTSQIFCEVNDPPPLFEEDLIKIFPKQPGTRSSKKITQWELMELAKRANIELIFKGEPNA